SPSPLLLENPSVIQTQVEIDSTMEYTVYERIGDIDYRPPTTLTFEEFTALQNRKMMREYWKTRSRGLDGESPVSGRGLIPPIYISLIFDKIFGGDRKSTRLNSSHVKISYAVFCLKKKNIRLLSIL